MNLIKLGSEYGGWIVPDIFNHLSICYFAGVGEDITFDIDFLNLYNCEVNLIDPTPRAINHVNEVISLSTTKNIYPNPKDRFYGHYKTSSDKLQKIKFHNVGLGKENNEVVFYPPANNLHVSHSVYNLQNTREEDGFKAKCESLSSLMKKLNHKHIDCLKLDIEGSEIDIINEMITKNIKPSVLCVEFDFCKKNKSLNIADLINEIKNLGYTLASDQYNHTFILNSVLSNN